MAFDFVYTSSGGEKCVLRPLEKDCPVIGKDFVKLPDGCREMIAHTKSKEKHVLSRIRPAGNDNTGRSGNYIVHHLVLEEHELIKAGPAWLLNEKGHFFLRWEGQEIKNPAKHIIQPSDCRASTCPTWREMELLNEGKSLSKEERCMLIFDQKYYNYQKLLTLIGESLSLIDSEERPTDSPTKRWDITFCTCATRDNLGNHDWNWVCVPIDDQTSINTFRKKGYRTIDLINKNTK